MDKSDTESYIKMIDVDEQTSIDLFQYQMPAEEDEEINPDEFVDTDEFLNSDTTDAEDDSKTDDAE